MIRRTVLMGLAALMAVSCSKSNTAVVNARIEGAANKDLVVSQLAVNQIKFVDSVKTDASGNLKSTITLQSDAPDFYYLSYNGKRLASLILKPGDKVNVTVDTLGKGLAIEGSEESVLLQKYNEMLAAAVAEFDALSVKLADASQAGDREAVQQYNSQMGKVFVRHKQNMIRNVMQNPYAFANIQALYQTFVQGLPVFGSENDHMLVQRVHDSLQTVYPGSVYLKSLQEQVASAKAAIAFAEKLSNAQETSFPNISLPDINAKNVELASLEGKPFILMFWASTDVNHKMFNNDLLDIYRKYSKSGLEIYQVAVDTDKTAWATAVKEQNLPWISVCDGKGAASPALATYNIYSVPSIFVFDRKGDIVASQGLFSKAALEDAVRKAVR
ncbi:MAG: TlpA family protein disulfide reductase [Bacteroidales bacterium]|nr:TlpA family protein disulfide reductase [Bacteroidales bacterium]